MSEVVNGNVNHQAPASESPESGVLERIWFCKGPSLVVAGQAGKFSSKKKISFCCQSKTQELNPASSSISKSLAEIS